MAHPGPSQGWAGPSVHPPPATSQSHAGAPPPTPSLSTSLTTAFPETAGLSRPELQKLLGAAYHPSQPDDDFLAFVEGLEATRRLRGEVKRLRDECEALAASNLGLKPQLDSLRGETQAAFDRAKALEAEWPRVEAQQREAYKRFAPEALHATLSQSLSKLHDESESLASAYVEGLPFDLDSTLAAGNDTTTTTTGIDDEQAFVRRYRNLRNTYHRRNIVAERWAAGGVTWRDE